MKWLVMGLVLIGFGGLCIKDGALVYPQQQAQYEVYEGFAETDNMAGWVERAESEGWSTDPPPARSDMDIYTQWGMLAISWPLGFAALGMVIWFRGRKLVATEEALVGHRGERVLYNSITAIDKERWDSKGIAYVLWEEGEESGRIKIDDWVFRDAWRVLDEVEDQTGLGEPVPG